MRDRVQWMIGCVLVVVATATTILVVCGVRSGRQWHRDRSDLAALAETIAELRQQVGENKELQPSDREVHQDSESIVDGQELGNLLNRRVGPVENLSPLACKLHVATACQRMHMRLQDADVAAAPNEAFGFAKWTREEALPGQEQVGELLRQVELTEELTYLIGRAGPSELHGFAYLGGSYRGGDFVAGFRLEVSGEPAAIRALLREINGANYLYVVRSIDWRLTAAGEVRAVLMVEYMELEPVVGFETELAAAKVEPAERRRALAHP